MYRRPARKQRFYCSSTSRLACIMQRMFVMTSARVPLRTRVQQRRDGAGVAAQCGDVQRGAAKSVGLVHQREPLGSAKILVQVQVTQADNNLVQGCILSLINDGGKGKVPGKEVGRVGILLDPEEEGGCCTASEGAVEASGVVSIGIT